ncbi:MAG: AtpZ/AtpI family protein [Terriglobales bacterium]
MAEGKSMWVQLARYSQLALVLPLCTAMGYAIGWVLNHKWLRRDWVEIAGLLLGIAAGFVELIRTVSGSVEEEKTK